MGWLETNLIVVSNSEWQWVTVSDLRMRSEIPPVMIRPTLWTNLWKLPLKAFENFWRTFEEHSRNIREHKSTSHLEQHQNWDITTNGHQIRICRKMYISHSVTIMCFRSVLTELWIFRRSSRMFQKLHNSKTQNSETLTKSKPRQSLHSNFHFLLSQFKLLLT